MRPYQSISCSDGPMCCPKISWALTCYQQIGPCESSWQRNRTGDRQIGRWCAEVKEAHGRWGGCSNPILINCSWLLMSEKKKKRNESVSFHRKASDLHPAFVTTQRCELQDGWQLPLHLLSFMFHGHVFNVIREDTRLIHWFMWAATQCTVAPMFQGMLEYSGSPFWILDCHHHMNLGVTRWIMLSSMVFRVQGMMQTSENFGCFWNSGVNRSLLGNESQTHVCLKGWEVS